MAGSRRSRTVFLDPSRPTSVSTVLSLLTALLAGFGLLALFMARHHDWTERLLGHLAVPGSSASLAADSALPFQLRIGETSAWYTSLADQTPVLVVRADLRNDALIEVGKVIVEARALSAAGSTLGVRSAACGTSASNRLLRRLRRDELHTLAGLTPTRGSATAPGAFLHCQVMFAGMKPGAMEVVLRIVSAEPLAGHSPPLFHPTG